MRQQAGFTLIELMITIVIMGILAAITIPNYLQMAERSKRASCVSNQRNIVEGAVLYIIDNNVVNAISNVTVLQAGGYINTPPSECPSSTVADFDDYTITIVNGDIDAISCDEEPVEHLWEDH